MLDWARAFLLTFPSCCRKKETNGGIVPATESYINAKQAYVSSLAKALGVDSENGAYRLVAVVGPQWRIGDVIDINKPLNIISEKCLFQDSIIPDPIQWSELPGWNQEHTIDINSGIPKTVLEFLSNSSNIQFNFSLIKVGKFQMKGLQSRIVAENVFKENIGSECKKEIPKDGALIVRGIVSGIEIFKSTRELSTGVNVKIQDSDIFKFKYDDKGGFELEDKVATPKMFLMAYVTPKTEARNKKKIELTTRRLTEEEEIEVINVGH